MSEARAAELPGPLRVATAAAALTLSAAAISTFGMGAEGLVYAALCSVLAIVAAFDLEHGLIPNRIVLPAIALLLLARLVFFWDEAWQWPVAGIAAALVLYLPSLVRSGAVGMGDVKLAMLLGVALGGAAANALLIGSLAVGPVALGILIVKGASARRETIPLAPFLALGGIVAVFLT